MQESTEFPVFRFIVIKTGRIQLTNFFNRLRSSQSFPISADLSSLLNPVKKYQETKYRGEEAYTRWDQQAWAKVTADLEQTAPFLICEIKSVARKLDS